MSRQSEMWRGSFGDDYAARNRATPDAVRSRVRAFAAILQHLGGPPPTTILECGANVGINLRALAQLVGAELFAVEPNERARTTAVASGAVPADHACDATLAALPFDDASIDLVFTSGVLIHVPPDELDDAYREMHRVARRYLLTIEYFAQTPQTVTYRGERDLLFKRDFGLRWLELFPDLEPIAQGFFWKPATGLDDLTWWLFRRPAGA